MEKAGFQKRSLYQWTVYHDETEVSILVLMDIELKRIMLQNNSLPQIVVSILVLMDIELKLKILKSRQRQMEVSILVLMDIELKREFQGVPSWEDYEFQSLF